MASLLGLSREIRDEILQWVLQHERTPPAGREQQLAGEERVPIVDVRTGAWLLKHKVLYEPKTAQPTATPLLLVNRQLNAEVQDAVARLQRKEGRSCKVDVMLLEEKELWVTPLRTPTCSPVLDQVEAVIRMVGVIPDSDLPAERTIWDKCSDGPPYYKHTFYYALERFLRAGPTGRPVAAECFDKVDRHMVVHRLVLNFVTPTPDEQHPLALNGEYRECMAARCFGGPAGNKSYRKKLLRPEWLANELLNTLRFIIRGGKYEVRYARLVLERVGVITVQIDGRPYQEIDVGAHLRGMKFRGDPNWPGHQESKDFYRAWRKEVFAARAAAGLA
ncbi:hypothetical protein PG985_013024 [Apiospora marii]|uniref:Uncharacterized protein n=1 Tax=Apiospora marii TaxID=335849 RepID=A0ABR1R975_9PEZI